MSKKLFDLIAMLLAVAFIFVAGRDLFDFQYGDPRAWGNLIAYVVFVIAIRRFFYNKKK